MALSTPPGDAETLSETSPLLSTTSSPSLLPVSHSHSPLISRHDSAISSSSKFPSAPDIDFTPALPSLSPQHPSLSWRSAYILTISRVLGSGIFATPGVILSSVGSPALSLLLWVVGAILAFFSLAVMLEFGCMFPFSGGEKVYLEFVYRKPKFLVSVLVAVNAILLGFTASNCIVFAQYVLFAFGVEGTGVMRKGIAVGLLTGITVVHGVWVKMGVKIQNWLGWVKIGMLVFMVLSGGVVVVMRGLTGSGEGKVEDGGTMGTAATELPRLDWSWAGLWAGSIWSWGAIATSILKVFYSFAGLNNINNVMSEVKNPVQTLKSVTLTALATACGMYLLVNVAYFSVVPLEEIKASGELIAALYFERVFGQAVGRKFLPIMVALGCVGNVMVVTYALARLNQEIARTGLLPFSELLSSNAPFASPLGGLLLHYIPSVLVITIPSGDVYSFILEVEGYPGQIFSLAIGFGLLWLRYKRPDLERPYKAWLPGVWIRNTVSAALVVAPFFPSEAQRADGILRGSAYALVGIAVLIFGVLYWLMFTILIPKWRGCRVEDETKVLDDGTTITKLSYVPL